MKRMHKLFPVILLAAAGNLYADAPVIDITNILGQIDVIYNTYESLMNGYDQLVNLKNQYEQAYNALKGFSFDDINKKIAKVGDAFQDVDSWEALTDRDKVLNTRAALKNAVKQVAKDEKFLKDTTTNFFRSSIKTESGNELSIASLYGATTDKQEGLLGFIADVIEDTHSGKEALKEREKLIWGDDMTPKEKMDVARAWGMTPDQYRDQRLVSEMSACAIQNMINSQEYREQNANENAMKVEALETAQEEASSEKSTQKQFEMMGTTALESLKLQERAYQEQARYYDAMGKKELADKQREKALEKKEQQNKLIEEANQKGSNLESVSRMKYY